MNTLFNLFNTIRKRRVTGYLSLLLACIFATGSLTGCGSNHDITINDAEVDLTPTDQLVIELPGITYLSKIYSRTITDFQAKYPDIQVAVTYTGERADYTMSQYQAAIGTEIMAGVGPDVILTDYFPDLYKTMDTGVFLNLNSIIRNCQIISCAFV